MSNMNIVVEFTAGTSILEAVIEAKEKAVMWAYPVWYLVSMGLKYMWVIDKTI